MGAGRILGSEPLVGSEVYDMVALPIQGVTHIDVSPIEGQEHSGRYRVKPATDCHNRRPKPSRTPASSEPGEQSKYTTAIHLRGQLTPGPQSEGSGIEMRGWAVFSPTAIDSRPTENGGGRNAADPALVLVAVSALLEMPGFTKLSSTITRDGVIFGLDAATVGISIAELQYGK